LRGSYKEASFYREIIQLLVKYFIRRNITDFPNTRNLDQIFIDLIDELNKDDKKIDIGYITDYFTNHERFSPKNEFEKYLNGDLYELNVEATRFILSKIEESKRQTREIYANFWQKDRNNKPIWTIEHVFPEGKNIPRDWVNMIADGDRERAEILQEKYVHKLGNLTLTGYNQNLSNFDFRKKRDRKSNGKDIGYKNKLFLNEALAQKDEWKVDDIEARTKELVRIAVEIFDINRK
jgi:HEPN domain-containing protein